MINRNAAGPDALNSELYKYRGPVLSHRLRELINKCWREILIPGEWGQARVKSLLKKGIHANCSNYRAIGLLNSAYKIYVKIIAQPFKTISSLVRYHLVSLEFFIDIKSFR